MRRWLLLAAASGLLAASCSSSPSNPGDPGLLNVVTTVSPITNIVQNIGGDKVSITGVVPEGVNSHTFEPAPSDAGAFEQADIVFMNGLHLEEPTKQLAEANVRDGVPMIELGSTAITPDEYIYDFSFPASGGDPNPHLWTDPVYAGAYAKIVTDRLGALDPANAAYYRQNDEAFQAKVDQLDGLVEQATKSVPAKNRVLLTYHDSFPYFARRYGWTVIGAIQPSDFSEPAPQEVAALIEQIRGADVPAIFGSEVFPSPVLQQIADESGAIFVEALRDDDLPGDNGDPDHSYLALMVFDLKTIVGALGGDAALFDAFEASNLQSGANADYRS
jgi:ABC-type Zn uptake system ZnuABC Zn-binding protein ZnuA